ncbi:MAG: DUF4388 domain-containing protein [Flavobacteriaceae bacterium]|nr:DUF4388 domain-containing protein [Desulfofustis sp.]NNK71244.1 DUF4388 domain-containing protein [Flavobacteriaceae bacterium]
MKNILLLTSNESQLESIVNTCKTWGDEDLSFIPVEDENEAVSIALNDSADLLICDVAARTRSEIDKLYKFTYSIPYVPCIAIINSKIHKAEDLLKVGVSCCLETPYHPLELYRWTFELLEVSTSSVIKGIPIHSLVQMLETEGKTCTLKVKSEKDAGFLFVKNGSIVSAEHGPLTKDDAVYSVLALENSLVEIKHYNGLRKRDIHQNAMSLIMEALRLQDERKNLQETQEQKHKARLDLKQFTPASSSIEAEIGAKLKLEIEECEKPLMSSLVGIVPGQYILLTVSQNDGDLPSILKKDREVVVRYLNLGKLCLFKTRIKDRITAPSHLLFLEFPSVIFYHELRKQKRIKIFVPSIIKPDEDKEFYSVIRDLSILGCLCEIKAKLNSPFPDFNIGDIVTINCLLPGLDEKELVKGIIRNLKKTSDQLRLGIQFDNPSDKVKGAIENYLKILKNVV